MAAALGVNRSLWAPRAAGVALADPEGCAECLRVTAGAPAGAHGRVDRPPDAVLRMLDAVAYGGAYPLRDRTRDAMPGPMVPWAGRRPTHGFVGVDDRSLHPSTDVGRD